MAYGFMIGPDGAFGIDAYHWTPLHASTDGWVESLALAVHARRWAKITTRLTGKAAAALDLGGYEPVPEVQGVTDTWWRGKDSLVALYRGEAVGLDAPQCLEAQGWPQPQYLIHIPVVLLCRRELGPCSVSAGGMR